MTQEFKAGDKVRIVKGGWGIHPEHVGKVVTIHACADGGRYTIKETLEDPSVYFTHTAEQSHAGFQSFELLKASPTDLERVREINELIRTLQAEKAALVAVITAELEL